MKYINLPIVAVSMMGLSLAPALAQGTIKLGNIVVGAGVLKGPGEPSIAAVDIGSATDDATFPTSDSSCNCGTAICAVASDPAANT